MKVITVILLAGLLPSQAAAQSRDRVYATALDLSTEHRVPSALPDPSWTAIMPPSKGRATGALVAGGLAGGAVGVLGGFYIGALIGSDENNDDLDFLSTGVAGAAIGEGLLLPLGVHLANRKAGGYMASALLSLGLSAAGLLILEAVHYDSPGAPIVLLVIPLAQIGTSIAIERATE